MAQSEQAYRIVVGMDLEEAGDVALVEALRLAQRVPGSEVHPVYAIAADPAVQLKAVDDMSRHLGRAMQRLAERVERICADLHVSQRTRLHVRFGDPVKVLQQIAVDYDADAIVVGTHGRRGVERLLLGSVASDLVRVARLPVIVARPKDFQGLEKTEQLDPARPGEDLSKKSIVSDVIQVGRRDSHIAGLI
ncbi:universal stress protein [Sandaracinus amylolyticus]|uniref:universal stress protein n=1 Tax=Sandaracinus amylolyticus TaxID=927083 RepID=UPI001F314EE2|nr:universal stress protein [Sandaracinus amylolyticus]UJR78644.1 Universal stress protein UspA [Sandaracinus amylolyticus]